MWIKQPGPMAKCLLSPSFPLCPIFHSPETLVSTGQWQSVGKCPLVTCNQALLAPPLPGYLLSYNCLNCMAIKAYSCYIENMCTHPEQHSPKRKMSALIWKTTYISKSYRSGAGGHSEHIATFVLIQVANHCEYSKQDTI